MRSGLIGISCILAATAFPAQAQNADPSSTVVVSTIESEEQLAAEETKRAKLAEERAKACREGTANGRFICFGAPMLRKPAQSSDAIQPDAAAEMKNASAFDLGAVNREPETAGTFDARASSYQTMRNNCRDERAERIAAGLSAEGPKCRELARNQTSARDYPGLQPAPRVPADEQPKSRCITQADGSTKCSASVTKTWGTSEEAKRRAEDLLDDVLTDD